MERNTAGKNIESINRRERLSPEMAFVAIVDTEVVQARPDVLDWRIAGACSLTDAEAFYPGVGENVNEAKSICARCDERVKAECLEDALEHRETYGVRGGLTVREREKLLRKRHQNNLSA